ncbi:MULTISPECIES: hypothetical protein [Acetobacter]|nr:MULTISPECIES: hypothetical protein [Acetobacter]
MQSASSAADMVMPWNLNFAAYGYFSLDHTTIFSERLLQTVLVKQQ